MSDLPRIIVVGSANLDLVFNCPQLPLPGQTLLGGTFMTHPGGKGANQAAAIGKLGGNVDFVACLGDDANGHVVLESIEGANVSTRFIRRGKEATGTASIVVDTEGRNMIVVASGANMEVSPEQVADSFAGGPYSVVLTQLEVPMETVAAASWADRFILNPAPAQEIPAEILARCAVLTPNETEAEGLTGICPSSPEGCREAGRKLLDSGVENVIITLGERGCILINGQGEIAFPARSVKPVDTVGAGDAFNGALAMFLAETEDLMISIPRAIAVAGLSTTKPGAVEAMPTFEELRGFAPDLFS